MAFPRTCIGVALLVLAACSDPPPPAAIDAATLRALLQRLDRVAAALEAAPRAAAAPTTASPASDAPAERAAVASDATALQARVSALEAELAVLRAQPAAMAARPSGFVATPPMRAASVQTLKEMLTRDEQQSSNEAFRSVFLLGPAQVLERFGTPSSVFTQANGTCMWNYEGEHTITISFVQGVVVRIE